LPPNWEGESVPYVHVRVAGDLSRDQKAKIAEEITQTLARVANKPPSLTYVTIEEVKFENWAVAGTLLDETG
jgi:4-oxalocrotonate tautomerase